MYDFAETYDKADISLDRQKSMAAARKKVFVRKNEA